MRKVIKIDVAKWDAKVLINKGFHERLSLCGYILIFFKRTFHLKENFKEMFFLCVALIYAPFRAPTVHFVQNNCVYCEWHDKIRKK